MTRQEFLNTLQMQLRGELSQAQIDGHLHYYNEYISEGVAAGKTENAVLEELGNPVFIAKTLLEAAKNGSHGQDGDYGYTGYGNSNGGAQQSRNTEEFYEEKFHTWHVNPFIAKWVVPAVLIAVLLLILTLVGSAIALVARFIVPILLVVVVIAIFKSHGRR